jgi:hypothetical protein
VISTWRANLIFQKQVTNRHPGERMAVIQFLRETLTLDDRLTELRAAGFAPRHGDTLVFGARECRILSLPSDYDYVIAADRLDLPAGSITLQDTLHRQCCITVLAEVIEGPFSVISKGTTGEPGAPGEPGDIEIINGKPHLTPGGSGGAGADGAQGDPGGLVRIHHSEAAAPASANATPTWMSTWSQVCPTSAPLHRCR